MPPKEITRSYHFGKRGWGENANSSRGIASPGLTPITIVGKTILGISPILTRGWLIMGILGRIGREPLGRESKVLVIIEKGFLVPRKKS